MVKSLRFCKNDIIQFVERQGNNLRAKNQLPRIRQSEPNAVWHKEFHRLDVTSQVNLMQKLNSEFATASGACQIFGVTLEYLNSIVKSGAIEKISFDSDLSEIALYLKSAIHELIKRKERNKELQASLPRKKRRRGVAPSNQNSIVTTENNHGAKKWLKDHFLTPNQVLNILQIDIHLLKRLVEADKFSIFTIGNVSLFSKSEIMSNAIKNV